MREDNKDYFLEKKDRLADLKYLMAKFNLNLNEAKRMQKEIYFER